MKIKDMFAKKIDREIQGVIIVGQGEDANVSQELEEYVVTRELQKHFADFYSAYKKGIVGTTPKMGVWISGFFGSGKSHFLKILSYLLENRQVGDRKAMDYFVEDKKIVDPMVLADMKLAADTPTDVILFNIDSKSETNGKQNKDAIVNVFLKVFNQMQGFCGSIPHVADLERRLSEEGRYDEFKAAFEEEYGDPWEESRQDFDFIQDSVVDALVSMDFMSEAAARNWCEKAVEPYTISIEDFAKRVKNYIERKGNNHHVVFLVDEIGQYIGDDSKLMLNLQTVTEELGKECMGNGEFVEDMQNVELNNAKVYCLQPDNQFATKLFLERQDTTTNYLIYAPFPKPDVRDNHLEDTLLYSRRFFADRASLLSVDLGIDEKYKPIIEKHIKFFANKERTQRFYDLEIENFNEENIITGLLSAICRTRTCSFEEVIRVMLTDSELTDNKFLSEVEKYGLLDDFWKLCEQHFGYTDVKPTLEKLVVTMFVTYTAKYIGGELPKPWKVFLSYMLLCSIR